MKTPPLRLSPGFTLIEVLVALAIVAFGLAALFTTVNQTVRTADYMREKTLATWIALNRITEARLAGQPPADDEISDTVEFAGQSWRWELRTFETPVEGIVRLEARAAPLEAPDDAWPGLATGFLGAAVAPPVSISVFDATGPRGPGGGRQRTPGGGDARPRPAQPLTRQ
jgi:general secretion pathway protein I